MKFPVGTLRAAIITLGLYLSLALYPLAADTLSKKSRVKILELVRTSMRESPHEPYQQAAEQDFKIKLNVNLVTVDALVHNSRGTVVDSLREEDFQVYDNGIQQRLTHFSKDQLPLAIALVIDNSISTTSFFERLQGAALTALRNLKKGDEAVLFAARNCPAQLGVLTQDRNQIALAIGKLQIMALNWHYDAIYNACHYLLDKARDRRRAIIMISNGIIFPLENSSLRVPYVNEDDAIRAALEASVSIHSIKITNPFSSRPEIARVDRLSEETGGTVLKAGTPETLSESLNATIMNLRQAYTLGFVLSDSSKSEGYHRLEVKLKPGRCPGCRVQARNQYFLGSQMDAAPRPGAQVENETQPYDCEKAFVSRQIMDILSSKSVAKELPFQMNTSASIEIGGQQLVRFDIHIDANAVKFYRLWSGKWSHHAGRLAIAAYYVEPDGQVVEEAHRKIIDLRLDKTEYSRLIREGISYTSQLPVKDNQLLKIVVFDLATRKAGVKAVKPKLSF